MSQDVKADFYFEHHERIEEWAALRGEAARVLDDRLVSRLQAHPWDDMPGLVTRPHLDDAAWPRLGLVRPAWREAGGRFGLYLEWNRSQLLRPGTYRWPYVGVRVTRDQPRGRELRTALKGRLAPLCAARGWRLTSDMWPWHGTVVPPKGPLDVDALAGACLAELLAAWDDLAPSMQDVWDAHLRDDGVRD